MNILSNTLLAVVSVLLMVSSLSGIQKTKEIKELRQQIDRMFKESPGGGGGAGTTGFYVIDASKLPPGTQVSVTTRPPDAPQHPIRTNDIRMHIIRGGVSGGPSAWGPPDYMESFATNKPILRSLTLDIRTNEFGNNLQHHKAHAEALGHWLEYMTNELREIWVREKGPDGAGGWAFVGWAPLTLESKTP